MPRKNKYVSVIDKNHDGVDDRLYTLTKYCAIILPFTTIDQLHIIYIQGITEGVSALTWFLYGVLSIPLFLYSIQKKDTPMMLLNGLWVLVDFAVFFGVIFYNR